MILLRGMLPLARWEAPSTEADDPGCHRARPSRDARPRVILGRLAVGSCPVEGSWFNGGARPDRSSVCGFILTVPGSSVSNWDGILCALCHSPVGASKMRNPRDTTITCTKEARIKAKVLAAHLDIPVWQALDLAVTEMLRRQNLPEPLAFHGGIKE